MLKKSLVNGFAMQALVVVVVLGTTTPARAGQIFEFSYSLPGAGAAPMAVSASGFFATTDLLGNSYTITGAWGTWNGAAITGILAPGGFGGNDNLLFSSGPLLDSNGVGFMVNAPGDSGTGSVNVYYAAGQGGYTEDSTNVGGGPTFSISAATPSPVYFAFNYSIPGAGATPMNVSASGILTAFNTDANSYLVSGISGSWNGASILSLLSPGIYGGNDNLLFAANPHLTGNGLSFAVNGVGDDGTGNVNVYYSGTGAYTESSDNVDFTQNFNLSQTLSQTPEPASVTLMFTGIPFVLFLVWRRSRAQRHVEQKYIRCLKEGERGQRHQPKYHGNVSIMHS
jgi:hypothetical protein